MSTSVGLGKFQQARNLLANWGAFLLSAVAGLFLSPYVVRSLGADGYGLWTIVGSLTGTLGIFDLGLRSAVVRFLAREHARGDHQAASRRAGNLQFLFGSAAVLVLVVGGGICVVLPEVFKVPPALIVQGRSALFLSVLSLSIGLVGSVSAGVLMAMERLDILGASDIVFEAIRISLIVIALKHGGGIVALATIGLVLAVSRFTLILRAAQRVYPELRFAPRKPNREELVAILDVSLFSTLIYTSATLASQAGTLIVGAILPLAVAAAYAIGATLPEYASALNRPIAQTVHPRASRLDASNDVEGLQSLIIDTGKLSALVLLPVVVTFILRGRTFISLWQGEAFREPSGSVLWVLAFGILFSGPRHVMQAAFVGSGRHRALGAWYIGEALLRIVATLVLVNTMGLSGAAWAAVLPGIAMAAIVFPELCNRHFGVPRVKLVVQLWVRPVLSMLPFAVVLYLLDHSFKAEGYFVFFGQIALALPVAVLGGIFLALDRSERIALLGPAWSRVRALRSRSGSPSQ